MRVATNYVMLSVIPLVMTAHGVAQADNIFGGSNSIFNNPGQITGGPNSVINNPGQLKGGPNSVINNPGQVTQGIANALNELQASLLTGPTLERAIVESRNTAINGSMPIPPRIRQMLTGYASEDSMNRVRYKIGDSGFINLARLLEQGGTASAVTLIDVVVFRGPTEAGDPAIWAHELTHVDQYQAWGVHSFAVQYTRSWQGVENPAYAKGNGFWAWYQQQQGTNQVAVPRLPQQYPAPQPPQQVGAFCYAAGGRFGPGPVQPLGAPCLVTLPQGNFPGQVGP
jgi:hypothetical protein